MIAAARAALHALLTTDATFTAAIAALKLGSMGAEVVPKVRSGNRPFAQIDQREYPVWIDDAGPQQGAGFGNLASDPYGLVVNSTQQDWLGDIELSLVWHQQDHANAVAQTDALLPLLVRLLLRHPDLSGTCALAMVVAADSSQGERHPTHAWRATVRCHVTVYRD